MIMSMTGYGKCEAEGGGLRAVVEVRAVNNRYADISVRMPRMLNAYEDAVRKAAQKAASRGKIDVFVGIDAAEGVSLPVSLDLALAKTYFDKLTELQSSLGLKDAPTLNMVARFPDVLSVKKDDSKEAADIAYNVVTHALNMALADFVAMKQREGQALRDDMASKADSVEENMNKIKERSPKIAEDYRRRLLARMREALSDLGANADEQRIVSEAAIFADKTCIDEELTRLYSHIAQFRSMLDGGGAVGRKLDFLVQEMNREVNTIGSKSNDLELTRLVVDVKGDIEKIREQVQNIE